MKEIRVETWPLAPTPATQGLQRFGYRILQDEESSTPQISGELQGTEQTVPSSGEGREAAPPMEGDVKP